MLIVSSSLNCIGPSLSELFNVRVTSAIFFDGLFAVPAKITSSMPDPRMLFADVSPIHHLTASTIFDLPQPLGPTIPVNPFSTKKGTLSTKDLKPINSSFFISIFKLIYLFFSLNFQNLISL